MNKFFLFAVTILFLVGCKEKTESDKVINSEAIVSSEETLYRPNFHFTPKKGWMNDPNGMFFLNGKYNLYFQYYPDGNTWGPMHWGHATSEDLVTWEEQPIALYPDSLGYIFSGSAVVDVNNYSGFGEDGKPPVVAMYTLHDSKGEKEGRNDFQTQAIAYSLDEGQSFIKYDKNPVITNLGNRDFRDPKVVWDEAHKQWVMVLAVGQEVKLYSSKNLKEWKYISDFGVEFGSHDGVWECPDLFPIQVEGTNKVKWVLITSINPGNPNGGSGIQYFVGDFDGTWFNLDTSFEANLKSNKAMWLDYGRDDYAGVTWSNIPKSDGRRLFIGWMSNWDYAKVVPTSTWRSAMTLPRELKLKEINNGYRLYSVPVEEIESYETTKTEKENISFEKEYTLVDKNDIDVNKSIIEVKLSKLENDIYTFRLSNPAGDLMEFGINNRDRYYFIDRSKSGHVDFSDKFANRTSKANFEKPLENVNVQMVIDKTSIELFYNHGETVMTEIFFPNSPMENLKLVTLSPLATTIDYLRISEVGLKH